MSYKFDPLKYGYEPVSNFPELAEWHGKNSFIKVVAIGGEMFGRLVYWYSSCSLVNPSLSDDDRVQIQSYSYDVASNSKFTEFSRPRTNYNGLISSHKFAVELLCNLFGTVCNESVEREGKERFEANLNIIVHSEREKLKLKK